MRRARLSLKLLTALCLFVSLSAYSQQRPAITGIAFVRMYTADAAASAHFYKTLGLGHSEINGVTRYSVNDLQWLEVEALPIPAPASRLAAIAFTTRDAAALQRYLRANSVVIEQPLAHGSFAVHDPEGNLVYFIQEGIKVPGLPISSPDATSHRIIHTGFLVKDAAVEDRFYKDLLGFRPYWHGGMQQGKTDWVSQQVPDGTDWLEYMLYDATPSAKELGVLNHFSLGTNKMSDVVAALARNKCEGSGCAKTQIGKDGKVQLNLFDPDLTRIEYMEFKPSSTPCCSPILGKAPTEAEDR